MTEQIVAASDKEFARARELLDNPRVAWHSVNGFDFGACVGILYHGIEPYAQFGGREAISLAASPADPTLSGHPTFEYYVPKSISFPVSLQGAKVVSEDGHDEYQYERAIPRNEIYGIMVPETFTSTTLTELPLLKPQARSKSGPYIKRQLNALNLLSPGSTEASSSEELEHLKKEYSEAYDKYDARKQVAEAINYFILTQYEKTFAKLIGIDQPNLHQVISYLGSRYLVEPLVMPTRH